MKTLIYTVSSGFAYGKMAELTVPFLESYAARCGATFRHDADDKRSEYPLFDKFRVGNLLEDFDRVLFLDCDILVRPDSPNLFSLVPPGRWAALNEGSWCNQDELAARGGCMRQTARAFNEDGGNFDMRANYFNGGVFIACKEHKSFFAMPAPHPFMHEVTCEQNVLNLRLARSKLPTYSLPSCFNAMPWRWSHNYIADNYFIHFAGLKPDLRLQMLESACRQVREQFAA